MENLNGLLLQQSGEGGGYSGLLMIVAMIAIFYFFMIRPQNKKQKDLKKAREEMKNGDKVVTAGGIHAKIKEVQENVFILEIAPGTTIKVDKASVYPVQEAPAKK